MPLVVITIQDKPDGSVAVQMNTEPQEFPVVAKFTPAQRMGAVALNAIRSTLQEDAPRVIVPFSNIQ